MAPSTVCWALIDGHAYERFESLSQVDVSVILTECGCTNGSGLRHSSTIEDDASFELRSINYMVDQLSWYVVCGILRFENLS